ncbi:MAG: hypothetical protein WDZ69_03290 [Candidatus Pacearchaeota archaeon]
MHRDSANRELIKGEYYHDTLSTRVFHFTGEDDSGNALLQDFSEKISPYTPGFTSDLRGIYDIKEYVSRREQEISWLRGKISMLEEKGKESQR